MSETASPTHFDAFIISAASRSFGPTLLALLGSLNLNWPSHPPVLIYDLGMDQEVLETLKANKIEVRKVPPFVPHWRQHFTWKPWCLNDAPARDIIWMDAGLSILRPLEEIFTWLDQIGYFLLVNYELLDYEASEAACRACGVSPEFRLGKHTLPSGLMAFRKEGRIKEILEEAAQIVRDEAAIKATLPTHRHDQAILSLLMYKYFKHPLFSDGLIYLAWEAPDTVEGQKVWVNRRLLREVDRAHFIAHISEPGAPYQPKARPVEVQKYSLGAKVIGGIKNLIKRVLVALGLRKDAVKPIKIYNGVKD